MGVVYQARQAGVNRLVALKMILAGEHAGAQERARFRAEAEAVGRLQHPHIVPVYEVGEVRGQPYLVMEYVDGGSLGHRLAGMPLPPREAAQLVEALARAVHYAHQRGIVHRDLTPANVLLSFNRDPPGGALREAVPKVSDFGLAKFLAGGGAQTQTGALLGTPSYVAPEQAAGRTREVGPAADVYSLGAILYECLTGRPPFRAETRLETLLQVQTAEPGAPRRLNPRIPRDLETICLKCLRKEPARRYASARALADDLRRYLDGEPIQARAVGQAERLGRWCRRNPKLAGMTALAAVLLLSVAASTSLLSLRLDAALRGSREELFKSYQAQARAERFRGRLGQRFASLEAVQKAQALARELGLAPERLHGLRNEAIAALCLPDVQVAQEWDGWPPGSAALDFDAALRHYARSEVGGAVSVRRVSDDEEIARLPGPDSESWPLLSPDGRFLAVGVSDHRRPIPATVWRLGGGPPVPVLDGAAKVGWARDFSPDGRSFALGFEDGTALVYELSGGKPLRELKPTRPGAVEMLKFHPTDPVLALTRGGTAEVRDLRTGAVLAELTHPAVTDAIAWHPDGRTLAVGCNNSPIHLWDVHTSRCLRVLEGHTHLGIRLEFNHGGDLLASNDWHGVLRLWDPSTGRQLFETPAWWTTPRFSPDDRLLAADIQGSKVRLLRVAAGREFRTLAPPPASARRGYLGAVAISPDGRLLVTAGCDSLGEPDRLVFLDRDSGAERTALPVRDTAPVRFDPTGALWTYGEAGLLRWPVGAEPAAPGVRRFGPPQPLTPINTGDVIGSSEDGRVLALPCRDRGALLLHRDRPRESIALAPQGDVHYCAVSPNGEWVATGSHWPQTVPVKVWEGGTGKHMRDLAVEGSSGVGFSPDGRWLVTTGGGCRLWEVGSWREGPRAGGGSFAFCPTARCWPSGTASG
jgi:WD40 repeat protein